MMEMLAESQAIMDFETINERYADLVVAIATETGWTIDETVELPPWTLNQIVKSKERINKNIERDRLLEDEISKDKRLG